MRSVMVFVSILCVLAAMAFSQETVPESVVEPEPVTMPESAPVVESEPIAEPEPAQEPVEPAASPKPEPALPPAPTFTPALSPAPVQAPVQEPEQQGKPRVAFYFGGAEVKENIYRPLSGQITAAFVKSGDYIAIDRTTELNKLLTTERVYQMSGAVDDSQVAELGKEWGVQFVIPIEITKSIDGYYIEAKMVDVAKSNIVKMGNFESKLESSAEVTFAANVIVAQLLGLPVPERQAADPAVVVIPPKKMMFGLKFNYSFSQLSADNNARIFDAGSDMYYRYSISGDGTGFGIGLVGSYCLTSQIALNAEVLFTANNIEMIQSDNVEVNRRYDNNENLLSIQLVGMYNLIAPKYVAPYIEAGLRTDIVLNSDYSNRTGSDAGVIGGAGLTLKVWLLTGYLGYRCTYNITNFNKDGHAGMFIQHSGGLTVLY